MHRKEHKEMHNGKYFTDRVVVPESYRKEIPLSGHMGMDKTKERIEAFQRLKHAIQNPQVSRSPE